MIDVDVQVDDKKTKAFLRKVQESFARDEHLDVVAKVAAKTLASVIRETPKGYTGNLRQSWELIRTNRAEWSVVNPSKVMRFIEYGTQAHGPKKKKLLYIPLTRNAAIGGWRAGMIFGQDYVLTKRVRGITATGIVHKERRKAEELLGTEMRAFLTGLLQKAST